MLNQIILVGRLVRDIQVHETDSGKRIATLTLAVPRSFKNRDGLYDTDFFDCTLWDQAAINTSNYCKKSDILGIKGRLQSKLIEEDGKVIRNDIQIIVEKVTFLSSKRDTSTTTKQENSQDDY